MSLLRYLILKLFPLLEDGVWWWISTRKRGREEARKIDIWRSVHPPGPPRLFLCPFLCFSLNNHPPIILPPLLKLNDLIVIVTWSFLISTTSPAPHCIFLSLSTRPPSLFDWSTNGWIPKSIRQHTVGGALMSAIRQNDGTDTEEALTCRHAEYGRIIAGGIQ